MLSGPARHEAWAGQRTQQLMTGWTTGLNDCIRSDSQRALPCWLFVGGTGWPCRSWAPMRGMDFVCCSYSCCFCGLFSCSLVALIAECWLSSAFSCLFRSCTACIARCQAAAQSCPGDVCVVGPVLLGCAARTPLLLVCDLCNLYSLVQQATVEDGGYA